MTCALRTVLAIRHGTETPGPVLNGNMHENLPIAQIAPTALREALRKGHSILLLN